MDEPTRLAMRRKHATRGEMCECGRTVFGNGRVSHYRRCKAYLERYGWPFNEGDAAALRAMIRDAVSYIEDSQERLTKFLALYREACIEEARRRGALPGPPTDLEEKAPRRQL